MSIREQIQTALNEGWLVNMSPSLPSIPQRRVLFLSRRLSDELEHDLDEPSTMDRTGLLLSTFDTFLGGGMITIGSRNDKHAYMKRLEPSENEFWEIRSVDPKPSIRIFGRFAERDVFVATNKGYRNELGGFGSRAFQTAMTTCGREWRKCFHTWQPHTGGTVHDYISQNVVDLSDL